MPVKKIAKKPSVVVETKKISGSCGSACTCGMSVIHFIGALLLLANFVLLVVFYCQYTHMETMKVGGRQNYNLAKKLYNSQMYKDQVTQQINQSLQQAQSPTTVAK
ncbi:MAG: hypothetical protein WC875_05535 [Candidatus Absconditabacterales bacterium]|jgi:hypothetical protein